MDNEYQEIDLVELAGRIFSKWWLIAIFTVISMGVSIGITRTMITPIYEASTTVFIGKEAAKLADFSIADLEIGNQLVTDYNEMLQTNQVLNLVIKELSLDAEPQQLRANLTVSTIKDSRFMEISYTDPNPDMAMKVVDKISDILKIKAEEIVGVKNVVIVDYAEKPEFPVSPSLMKNAAVAGMLGMMAALFIIFVELMLDNTLKKEDDVEKELGLPVLGAIPKFKGEPR